MKRLMSALLLFSLLIALTGCGNRQETDYQNALDAMLSGDYVKASELFSKLGDYQDAQDKLLEAQYQYGKQLYEKGDYQQAEEILSPLGDRAADLLGEIYFVQAQNAISGEDYDRALYLLNLVRGECAAQAAYLIEAIQNLDYIQEIIEEIDHEYCRRDSPIFNAYLGSFGLDFTFDLRYELQTGTFYFDIYFPQSISTIASLFGVAVEEDEPGAGAGMEKELYMEFHDRGVQGVTVVVNRYENNGNAISTYSYGPEDYERETAEEAAKWSGDFRIDNGVLTSYTGSAASPAIPNSVTTIGDGAFAGNLALETISIPDSVIEIRAKAFLDCSNLKSVSFPANLEYIGNKAFQGCALTSLRLPKSLKSFGYHALEGDPITSLTFEEGITEIPSDVGETDCKLEELVFLEGVEKIGAFAFTGAEIQKLVLPSTLKEVAPTSLTKLEGTEIRFTGTKQQWTAVTGSFPKENVRCSDGLYSSYNFYQPTGQEKTISLAELRSLDDPYAYEGEMMLITGCTVLQFDGYQTFSVYDKNSEVPETTSASTLEDSSVLWRHSEGRPAIIQTGDTISLYGRIEYTTSTDWDNGIVYIVTTYFSDVTILEP